MNSISRRLEFKGYGNPAGPYWFMGIEEYGSMGGPSARDRFSEIEDLAHAHGKDLLDFPMTTLIPTWATMSRIALRLEGDRDWKERERVRRYQAERLGRSDGETFLCDLLPLPAKGTGHWEYKQVYPSRELYLQEVLPARRDMLATLFRKYRPRYVFCYGKEMWGEFARLFDTDFRPAVEERVKTAAIGNSTVVLTPFFRYYLVTTDMIDRIATAIQAPS